MHDQALISSEVGAQRRDFEYQLLRKRDGNLD
jgi:hypothetical protein